MVFPPKLNRTSVFEKFRFYTAESAESLEELLCRFCLRSSLSGRGTTSD